jgi:hypothetical protein
LQEEREELYDAIRELTSQLKLKTTIIENFVPLEGQKSIEMRAEWNEEAEAWVISHKNYFK